MKRFTALMLGTALAAALSFAGQADKATTKPKPAATTDSAATTTPEKPAKVKKHKKHAKKAVTSTAPAAPASSAPAAPAAPAKK